MNNNKQVLGDLSKVDLEDSKVLKDLMITLKVVKQEVHNKIHLEIYLKNLRNSLVVQVDQKGEVVKVSNSKSKEKI